MDILELCDDSHFSGTYVLGPQKGRGSAKHAGKSNQFGLLLRCR